MGRQLQFRWGTDIPSVSDISQLLALYGQSPQLEIPMPSGSNSDVESSARSGLTLGLQGTVTSQSVSALTGD